MDIKNLLEQWEKTGKSKLCKAEYHLKLPVHEASRVAALAEMYPSKTENDIIVELLSAALDMVEAALPYQQGSKIIAEDELGDPIYEDAGPTPRFLALSKKHAARLGGET